MSPTDKIISFKAGKAPPPAPAAEEMSEREESIAHLATFLLDNKDAIKSFVCGVFFEPNKDGDQAFHMLTSPSDVAEFALMLRLLDDGLRRHLME